MSKRTSVQEQGEYGRPPAICQYGNIQHKNREWQEMKLDGPFMPWQRNQLFLQITGNL